MRRGVVELGDKKRGKRTSIVKALDDAGEEIESKEHAVPQGKHLRVHKGDEVQAGEALVDLVPHAVPGGGPMNTAVACARLGAPTAFLGAVSTDEHGDAIWAHLEASGVDLRLTQRRDEATCRAEVIGDRTVGMDGRLENAPDV